MSTEPRIAHVMAESSRDPSQRDLGSTKDAEGRVAYFRERGLEVARFYHGRSPAEFAAVLDGLDASSFTDLFVEFPISWRAIRRFRRRAPGVRIHARSENAEFLHRLDWARATESVNGRIRLAVRAVRNVMNEALMARTVDEVLSISPWETERYWPRLGARSRARYLPYYLPDSYLPSEPTAMPDTGGRQHTCLCVTSTTMNPLIRDAYRNFVAAVGNAPADGAADGWRFAVTGVIDGGPGPSRIEVLGTVEDINAVVAQADALALLSDLGYGFKTKILDSICMGTPVLVTPGLYRRLPVEILPWVHLVDLSKPRAFPDALEAALANFPEGTPNDDLRRQHHAILDEIFGIAPAEVKR